MRGLETLSQNSMESTNHQGQECGPSVATLAREGQEGRGPKKVGSEDTGTLRKGFKNEMWAWTMRKNK